MDRTHTLTAQQWQIIQDMLEREHDQLFTEIHHTDLAAFKEQLRLRRNALEAILKKLQAVPVL